MTEDQNKYILKLALTKDVAHKLQGLRDRLTVNDHIPTAAATISRALAVFELVVDRLQAGEEVVFRNKETKVETLLTNDVIPI